MLTISRCRELLCNAGELSDMQIERLRDDLYAIADVVLDTFRYTSKDDQGSVADDAHSDVRNGSACAMTRTV